MSKGIILSSLSLVLVLAAVSCGNPSEWYYFDRSSGSGDTSFSFEFELLPAPVEYDLSIFTRLEGKDLDLYTTETIPMTIVLVSPSGETFMERFDFVVFSEEGFRGYTGRREAVSPYRSGISTDEYGMWKMTIRTDTPSSVVTGFGIHLVKRQ